MKKLTLALGSAALSTALLVAPASANSMSSYMENALIDVCKAAKSNNTIRFSNTVDSYRLKTETVALKVVCNGENISDFAATHGAYKTADRLNEALGDVSIEDVALNETEKFYVNF
ncbi:MULTISPECIES: DUF3718 domain-containing protein [unclassified Thalassotalea]|uniref:DUF3718 domain-containing protein n=1 Tax=unclassified Thalassotalea TaxID=2614972 RepID=UPI00108001D1|nr:MULTISPECIES: DUF3718 domain-containing protein [unclassified Thalassotalea]NMP17414.1 DUF3718 domain-containing protein [Thalassotalea sp. Y01]QBY02882.1 DUF3718 domain-containing protein [Thalassotalea sp. HSM 43]